ncbi:DUF5666 domain-containing protein [Rubrivivax gelatinosus]|uniref:DUF5666 domain-containing protein n=1 Tax=Rubrivivax gelatinosus TaxID=28068 RepID=UPI0019089E7B|nr:DUF5666 domain-containing protein [Rubrivivax gelatinosus]
MNQQITSSFKHWRPALAVLAVAALAACGGGGGSDDDVAAGDTGVFASGVIHGFGSVVVNGVRYDDSSAVVRTEGGEAAASDDLRLGMVVDIEAQAASTATAATATRIVVRSEVEGPVTALDAAAGTLTVLGQAVTVNAATVWEDARLSTLAVGDIVEVHGLRDADGVIVASRIDREDGDEDDYELRGTVAAADAAAGTLRIGALDISWGGAWPAALAAGSTVRVTLATAPAASGVWPALSLRVLDTSAGATDGVHAELEGLVTAYTSAASFRVAGVAVDASGLAGLPAGLAAGVRVEVEGVFAGGTLRATKVEIEHDADRGDDDGLEISAAIEALDATAKTLVLRGVTVDWSGARFEDGSAAQLAVGTRIEVQGVLGADGSTLVAAEVDFER